MWLVPTGMHNPSGNVWRCGVGTWKYLGETTRHFADEYWCQTFACEFQCHRKSIDQLAVLMNSQKILRKFCLQFTENFPINRNGFWKFSCVSWSKSQQHLPIWAQWCPGRGSPGGTRIYWASSMTWEHMGIMGPASHGHGEDGENHGGTNKNQQAYDSYAMFMGLMINHRIFLGGSRCFPWLMFDFQNHETQCSCFLSLFIASCRWLQWMTHRMHGVLKLLENPLCSSMDVRRVYTNAYKHAVQLVITE